jgi:hypothetical protein
LGSSCESWHLGSKQRWAHQHRRHYEDAKHSGRSSVSYDQRRRHAEPDAGELTCYWGRTDTVLQIHRYRWHIDRLRIQLTCYVYSINVLPYVSFRRKYGRRCLRVLTLLQQQQRDLGYSEPELQLERVWLLASAGRSITWNVAPSGTGSTPTPSNLIVGTQYT